MLILKDRVQETTTSPGTGNATLNGAVTGFRTFSSVMSNADICYYTIADQGGANWEVGIGTYSSSVNTLDRTTVLSSSNGGSLTNFSTGTQAVFITYPAEKSVNLNSSGNVSALGTISSGTWQGSTVAVAYGGTGVTTSTGTGSVVLSTSPSLTTPDLGTPSAVNLSNGTALPLTTGVSGILPTANGGTNLSSFTSGGAVYASSTSVLTTGTLPITAGGTGAATLTANNVLLGNGTSAVQFVAPGSSGNVLTSNGSTWASTAPGGAGNLTGAITSVGLATSLGSFSSSNLSGALTDETGTGVAVFATSPTLVTPLLGTPTSGNLSNCTADGTDAVGFKNIPQNSQSAAYTLVLADAGKHIFHPVGDNNARTFTIPANGSVAYPIGTAITFINQNGAGVVTIAITTDTMRLAGAGTTGSRTLAANGVATCIKVTSTEWIISGVGLT